MPRESIGAPPHTYVGFMDTDGDILVSIPLAMGLENTHLSTTVMTTPGQGPAALARLEALRITGQPLTILMQWYGEAPVCYRYRGTITACARGENTATYDALVVHATLAERLL